MHKFYGKIISTGTIERTKDVSTGMHIEECVYMYMYVYIIRTVESQLYTMTSFVMSVDALRQLCPWTHETRSLYNAQ